MKMHLLVHPHILIVIVKMHLLQHLHTAQPWYNVASKAT